MTLSIRIPSSTSKEYIHESATSLAKVEDLTHWDDQQIIEACLRNEQAAWHQLLDRYGGLIYTIALRFGFPHPEAEEIYQEVCLTAFEKLATIEEPRYLMNWLASVTRRQCIHHLRDRDYAKVQTDEIAETSLVSLDLFTEQILLAEQQEVVRQAHAMLNPRCRQLLQALFFAPLPIPYEELAEEFQVPTSSIGSLRRRCLDKLRAKLFSLDAEFVRTYPQHVEERS